MDGEAAARVEVSGRTEVDWATLAVNFHDRTFKEEWEERLILKKMSPGSKKLVLQSSPSVPLPYGVSMLEGHHLEVQYCNK